jgi:hypothetical protein
MRKREAVGQYKSPNTQISMYKQDANENVKTNLICKQEQWPMDQQVRTLICVANPVVRHDQQISLSAENPGGQVQVSKHRRKVAGIFCFSQP